MDGPVDLGEDVSEVAVVAKIEQELWFDIDADLLKRFAAGTLVPRFGRGQHKHTRSA